MNLADFTIELLEQGGGVAERGDDGSIHLLLPEPLAAELQLEEDTVLCPAGSSAFEANLAQPLLHGSELVERLILRALGEGHVTACRFSGPPPSLKSVDNAIEESFRPKNGVIRDVQIDISESTYLLFSYHYRALGEERREGLVDVALNQVSQASAPKLPSTLFEAPELLIECSPPAKLSIEPKLLNTARRLAVELTLQALEPVQRILSNRLSRDVQRLHSYLRSMQSEVYRTGIKRATDESSQAKLLERLNQIPAELERRAAQARARLAMQISLNELSLMMVTMPVLAFRANLCRRKLVRPILLHYGALQRSLDTWVCEGCRRSLVSQPNLCDQRAHVLCDACLHTCPICETVTCLACHGRCLRCQKEQSKKIAKPAEPAPHSTRQKEPKVPTTTKPAPNKHLSATSNGKPTKKTAPRRTIHQERPQETPTKAHSQRVYDSSRNVTHSTSSRAKKPPPPNSLTPEPNRTAPNPDALRPATAMPAPPQSQPQRASASLPSIGTQTASHLGSQAIRQLRLQLDKVLEIESPQDRVKTALKGLEQGRIGEIADGADLPLDTVRQVLKELRKQGLVSCSGHGRGVTYQLK